MVRIVAFVTLIGLVSLSAACSPGSVATTDSRAQATQAVEATPGTTAATTPPATPGSGGVTGSCGGNDVKAALTAASAAQNAADSYRVTGTITTATVLEAVLEVQKPDRIHVKAGDLEYISVGADTWQNVGGTWQATPNVDVRSLIGGMGQLDARIIESATFTNVSVAATTVDGAPAIEYSYHESIPGELEADVRLSLDPATCRPIRNVATSSEAGTSATFDVTYSDWNAVTVEAPM